MSELLKDVEANIGRRQLLRRGQRVLAAVSGGVDSMVLLDLLHRLAPTTNWRLTVAHLNHQLRGRSSDADERVVRRTAKKLGLQAVVERSNVRKFAREHKVSVEMAARKLRHEFFARTATRLQIPTIALAHHSDDQVELFFLRLLRGVGGQGIAGMKWASRSPSNSKIHLIRPLLDQPKSALEEYARGRKVPYREDVTNELLDIPRNRIRHDLLPLLRRKYQAGLDKTILRVMEIVGAESECVRVLAEEWLVSRQRRHGSALPRYGMGISGLRFEELPVAVQRRCLQIQLIEQGTASSFDLVEELRVKPEKQVSVVGESKRGGRPGETQMFAIRDSNGMLRVRQREEVAEFQSDSKEIRFRRGAGRVSFGGLNINWRIQPGTFAGLPAPQTGSEVFDADTVGVTITLRHWQPGDRFQPIGMKSEVKLQDLFTNGRISASQRKKLVLGATAAGEIFWVETLRISERHKLSNSTIRHLQWRWHRL